MTKHIAIWGTICEAFSLIKNNFPLFYKSLFIPFLLLLMAAAVPFMYPVPLFVPPPLRPMMPPPIPPMDGTWLILSITFFIQTLLTIWVINTCYRIGIQGHAGKKWWSMADTWTTVYAFLLMIIVNAPAGLITAAVFLILSSIANMMVAALASGIIYAVLAAYFMGRLILVLPGTAVNDKISFRDAWELSEHNNWHIIAILIILPILAFLTILLLSLPLSVLFELWFESPHIALFFDTVLPALVSLIVLCLNATALGLVYKQLRAGTVELPL